MSKETTRPLIARRIQYRTWNPPTETFVGHGKEFRNLNAELKLEILEIGNSKLEIEPTGFQGRPLRCVCMRAQKGR
jgi:hypothetical protein